MRAFTQFKETKTVFKQQNLQMKQTNRQWNGKGEKRGKKEEDSDSMSM